MCDPDHTAPAGCAVCASALASTMRDLLLPGEGSAVLMATRLGLSTLLLLLFLLLLQFVVILLLLVVVFDVLVVLVSLLPPPVVVLATPAAPAAVLGLAPAGAGAGVAAGYSAAVTRPHAPWPSSLQRLLVAAVMADALNCTPTWQSAGTGGVSAGMLCCWWCCCC